LLFPEQDSTETGLRDAFDTQAIEVIVRCTKFPKDFQL
jgi:hypothetical protein